MQVLDTMQKNSIGDVDEFLKVQKVKTYVQRIRSLMRDDESDEKDEKPGTMEMAKAAV